MAKKQLSGIQLPALSKINIDGQLTLSTAAGTSGQVLTSQGAGATPIWTTVSGGGSGFTGAGTSVTGIAGTNATGFVTVTSSNVTMATGTAITSLTSDPELPDIATSGNLYLKSGNAEGYGAYSGNIYLQGGSITYNGDTGFGSNGRIFIGDSNTSTVAIGWTDTTGYTSGGVPATTVNIMDKSSTAYSKQLNLVTNGDSTLNIATGANNTLVRIGTTSTTASINIGTGTTTPTVQIGTNVVASRTFLNGKNFFWQPSPPTTISTARTLTYTDLQTFIVVSSATTGNFPLPTGTLMDTNVQNTYTDMGFDWSFINTGASGSNTVTAGTAHTIVGSGAVAFGTSARFRSRRTGTNTWVTYRIS